VAVGSPSAPRTVTVSNQGPGGATITLVNAVGADAAQFTVTPLTCAVGDVLYEGSSCNLSVVYAPGFPGARSAQLQFASTGSPPTALSLTGVGSGGPTPMAALSDTTLSMGTVHVGARSAPVEVTLTSSGSGPLQVTATTINGPYTVSSKTCPALPFELPSGSRCVLTVSYQPTAKGVQAGALTVTSNAANGPHTVALSGQGEAAVDVSSGGCSLAKGDSLLDPTLWLLALAAVAVLWRRRVQALARAR
jgi:trimeric autotransporter adhesin